MIFLKDKKALKNYILFLLCAALIVGASAFYFNTADTKKSTSAIIFNTQSSTDQTDNSTSITNVKSSATTKAKTTAATAKTTAAATTVTETLHIDINSAAADELTKLKGIGKVLADEIISYRESHNGFRNIEDIMNVSDIGDGIFADIRDNIFVIDPVYDEFVQDETVREDEEETEYMPTLEEIAPIDINTADIDTLMLLPHVDEDIAMKIIDFREHTQFRNVYELLLIEGLSQNMVSDIVPNVTT